MRLGGIARHAHVLAVGQPPAMQRHFLHGGDDMRAIGGEADGGMAALPLQQARLVLLCRDEPERGAVVVAGGDALAFRVDGDAGNGGGVRQGFERRPAPVQEVQRPADRGGADPVRVGSHMLHPAAAVFGQHFGGLGGAGQLAVIAAGQEARFDVGAEAQHGAAMRLMAGAADMHGAITHPEAGNAGRAAERHAHDIGAEFVRLPPAAQQEFVFGGFAHPSLPLMPDSSAPVRPRSWSPARRPGRPRSRGAAAGG